MKPLQDFIVAASKPRVADRPVVPTTPGNARRGKGPDFGHAWKEDKGHGIGFGLPTSQYDRATPAQAWPSGEAAR